MPLSLSTKEVQGVSVVSVVGRIVFGDEANELRREVKPLVQTPSAAVILDLTQVSYVDSGGIGALVGLYTTARAGGGQMRLAGANAKVKNVLEITKLSNILGLFATVDHAAATFKRNTA